MKPVNKSSGHILPDVLARGLKIIFCGSAASSSSAREKAYYAGTGNKFWTTIFDIGLTPRILLPQDYSILLNFGIGLTDIAKTTYGCDQSIPKESDDPDRLHKLIIEMQPTVIAFVGKRAAKVFCSSEFNKKTVNYGLQKECIGRTTLYALPSPSGLAKRYWDLNPWQEMANLVNESSTK